MRIKRLTVAIKVMSFAVLFDDPKPRVAIVTFTNRDAPDSTTNVIVARPLLKFIRQSEVNDAFHFEIDN
ncbi:MAG: hypothetical protein AAF561_05530 [Planctomycetota bacterium]